MTLHSHVSSFRTMSGGGSEASRNSEVGRDREVSGASQKIAIYVFIDAFGWEIYEKYGFLCDTLKNAKRLETTFGFSSAADPSILTGRYPDEHGHWSSFYYSPETSPFSWFKYLSYLPAKIFDRWRVRHWLSRLLKSALGYTGYFELYSVPFAKLPYFDYLEKYDYFVPGGILKTDTIFDWCVQHNIPYYCSNWRHSEEQIVEENKAKIKEGKIELAYVYLPKLDGLMHNVGTNDPKVADKLRWLEEQVMDIYETASEQYEDVSLYVISDHGMADVTGSIDLIARIEALGLSFGKDYVAMYDSTMARFWFPNSDPSVRQKIEALLMTVEEGRIVSDEELCRMHVPHRDKQFGELFFLMMPGVLINPSYMGLKAIPGMHGYHPHHPDSYATMLSNRPIPDDIRSITDIRKTMQSELEQSSVARVGKR